MFEQEEKQLCTSVEESEPVCDRKDLINAWCRSLGVMHIAHHKAASRYAKRHRWFGSLSAILAAIVGTTIFASLMDGNVTTNTTILAGMLSMISAALTGAVTFLELDQRARRHLEAAADFQRLRRDMEEASIMLKESNTGINYDDFKDRWREVLKSSVPLPQYIHDEVNANYEKKYNKSPLCKNCQE